MSATACKAGSLTRPTPRAGIYERTSCERFNLGTTEKHDCGSSRVLRGGSWNNNENNLQSDNPNTNEPRNENNNIGFRISSPGIRKDPLPVKSL